MTKTKQEIDAAHAKVDELMRRIADATPDGLDTRPDPHKAIQAEIYDLLAALKAASRPH